MFDFFWHKNSSPKVFDYIPLGNIKNELTENAINDIDDVLNNLTFSELNIKNKSNKLADIRFLFIKKNVLDEFWLRVIQKYLTTEPILKNGESNEMFFFRHYNEIVNYHRKLKIKNNAEKLELAKELLANNYDILMLEFIKINPDFFPTLEEEFNHTFSGWLRYSELAQIIYEIRQQNYRATACFQVLNNQIKNLFGMIIKIAIEINFLPLIKFIERQGVDLGTFIVDQQSQKTALHLAIENNHPVIIEYLVKNKIGINIPDKDGMTPLHYAIRAKQLGIAQLLLENNADPFFVSKNTLITSSPLSYALSQFSLDDQQYLYDSWKTEKRLFYSNYTHDEYENYTDNGAGFIMDNAQRDFKTAVDFYNLFSSYRNKKHENTDKVIKNIPTTPSFTT